jgi:hypothetical protein
MIYKTLFLAAAMMVRVSAVSDYTCQCSGCDLSSTWCEAINSSCEGADYDCSDDDMSSFDCYIGACVDDDALDQDYYDSLCATYCSGFGCTDGSSDGCGGGSGSDDDTCFHADTLITYKGKQYTMKELQAGKEPECTVPHTPRSRGVVIETSCNKTVRVTDTHLMATPAGFQLAYSLKAGDKLFGDYDNKEVCVVESINKEKTTQTYFGLNCVHSEVLAAGVRASTFGDFHTLPSWYMYYVGGSVGVDRASAFGEYIAEWYYSM